MGERTYVFVAVSNTININYFNCINCQNSYYTFYIHTSTNVKVSKSAFINSFSTKFTFGGGSINFLDCYSNSQDVNELFSISFTSNLEIYIHTHFFAELCGQIDLNQYIKVITSKQCFSFKINFQLLTLIIIL